MTPDLVYFSTMSTANLPLTAPPGGGLELEAQDVLAGVRRSIRGVLEQLRGPSARPRDLEQALGLHKTLAWRVLRVAYGRDPLADVQHIPGGEGIEKFLSAAEVAGVEKVRLVTVRESVARFRALVDTHAGDRPSLEVMLRSMTDAPEPAADLRATRRAAFRCASYTWGTQTKARILSGIFTPCGGGLADVATVRAHVAMRRVRREGQLGLSRTVESATDKPGPRSARVEAVEPEGLLGGVPLLRDCCTRPLPEVEAVPAAGNNIDYRFVDQRIGARGAVTAYTAEIRRGLPGCLKRDESNTRTRCFWGCVGRSRWASWICGHRSACSARHARAACPRARCSRILRASRRRAGVRCRWPRRPNASDAASTPARSRARPNTPVPWRESSLAWDGIRARTSCIACASSIP